MDKHIIQVICERGHEDGPENVSSYSGRGMYGKKCLGISCGNERFFIADLFMWCQNMEEVRACADEITGMKSDSLGRGHIVYFPAIEYVSDDQESDEEGDQD